MERIYELQADVLKTLANPRRLEILHRLADGPCEVGRLAAELGMSQPNVSQHLALMRNAGVVIATREGREVHYRLSDGDDAAKSCRAPLRRNPSEFIQEQKIPLGIGLSRTTEPCREDAWLAA